MSKNFTFVIYFPVNFEQHILQVMWGFCYFIHFVNTSKLVLLERI